MAAPPAAGPNYLLKLCRNLRPHIRGFPQTVDATSKRDPRQPLLMRSRLLARFVATMSCSSLDRQCLSGSAISVRKNGAADYICPRRPKAPNTCALSLGVRWKFAGSTANHVIHSDQAEVNEEPLSKDLLCSVNVRFVGGSCRCISGNRDGACRPNSRRPMQHLESRLALTSAMQSCSRCRSLPPQSRHSEVAFEMLKTVVCCICGSTPTLMWRRLMNPQHLSRRIFDHRPHSARDQ